MGEKGGNGRRARENERVGRQQYILAEYQSLPFFLLSSHRPSFYCLFLALFPTYLWGGGA